MSSAGRGLSTSHRHPHGKDRKKSALLSNSLGTKDASVSGPQQNPIGLSHKDRDDPH